MKKTSLTLAFLLLAGALIWVGWSDRQNRAPVTAANTIDGSRPLTATAKRSDMEIRVDAHGSVITREAYKVVCQTKSRSIIKHAVSQGDRVQAGDILLELVSDAIDESILKAEDKFRDLETKVSEAETALAIRKIENKTTTSIAENSLRSAQLNHRKFLEADAPQQSREADLSERTAESDLLRARQRLEELRNLATKNFVTQTEVEEQRILVEKAEVALDGARIRVRTLRDYDLPVQNTDLSNKVDRAALELLKVQTANENNLKKAVRALETAQKGIELHRENLASLKERRTFYTYHSPVEGIVYYGDTGVSANRRIKTLEVGEDVSPGQVLMSIPVVEAMEVEVQVPESDVRSVLKGQQVELAVDAVPDRKYTGTVRNVAEVATDQGYYTTGVQEFKVGVDLQDHNGLKQGYSCRGSILINTIEDAVQIPIQSVFREGKTYVVFRPDGSRTEVVPGSATMTHVEIRDGLSAGDQVLLARPAEG